jgi:hypothetical protein
LTKAEAAQRYLRIVAPSNKTGEKLNALGKGQLDGHPLTTRVSSAYRAAALADERATRKFMGDMLAVNWPADIQPVAGKVVEDCAPLVTTLHLLSKAKTAEDVQNAWDADTSSNASAQLIRVMLGLPAAGS